MKKKIGTAMVVGAGISGVRCALDLAEVGYNVTLIDRAPHLGGILSQLDYQFPTDRCGMCKMLPLVNRDASSQYCLRKGLFHENIEILLSTELTSVEGEPGDFKVTLRRQPHAVDSNLCIGCGDCARACPVEVPDLFNMGLTTRKAIYLPVPHNIPNTYVIDLAACDRCGACVKACPSGAIKLPEQKRKKFRILVVDDELIVRDSLKEWLEDEGFFVEMAESGPKALELLSKQPYHLMLTDIKMPGMDGVEVLKKTKEEFPAVAVVMMTAYATVETAIDAMKTGALDYLIKPFDSETFISKLLKIYQTLEVFEECRMETDAIVLCGGTEYFNPAEGMNTFCYGIYPDVVTSREFERLLSGTGPSQGRLVRPSDGKPVRKIAWFQCVGSRDLQTGSDFCSSVCCMHAIKEARLVKAKASGDLETAIFYMDMRTFGKSFQRYRVQAESKHDIRFVRGRVHSVIEDKRSNSLQIRYVDHQGALHNENFDMVVLSIGQKPSPDAEVLAETTGIALNQWGFCQPEPFSTSMTGRAGIMLGGSFTGLKDISESVIQASSAALSASRAIHASGGSLAPEPDLPSDWRDVSRELPRVIVIICTCGEILLTDYHQKQMARHLAADPAVGRVVFLDNTCTANGWASLLETAEKSGCNRILIGACLPYLYARKIGELGSKVRLNPVLIDVVDIRSQVFPALEEKDGVNAEAIITRTIKMGLARLKRLDAAPVPTMPVIQQALVVGGGIAGMTAALAIADHGYKVDIVEQKNMLGGNLLWLHHTLEGHSAKRLLEETLLKVEKHPLIKVHPKAQVIDAYGQVGHFYTVVKSDEASYTLEHGVTIIATGGAEANTSSYSYGTSEAIVTQKQLEIKIEDKTIDPCQLESVVMIQCVDSRQEPRNYCSRVCCATALKNALHIKEQNPDTSVYIIYRDIMAYGFAEAYFTQARNLGVIFIQYDPDHKPRVSTSDKTVKVIAYEPIIGSGVEIDADLVVLAPGVAPTLPHSLVASLGASADQDGFFQEAESKWRPVDSLKEGIFACGLAHSPRNITESISSAEAAGQRALRIICDDKISAGKNVAQVRHAICSLCERCLEACPYGARTVDSDSGNVVVNPVMCQGCGSCAAVCPNSAAILSGFEDQQIFEVIDSAIDGTL